MVLDIGRYFVANVILVWSDRLLRIKMSKKKMYKSYKAFQKIASKDSGRFCTGNYNLHL